MLTYLEEDLDSILKHTAKCWESAKNKTFFITGGTGFFGIWLQMSFIFINRKLNLNSKVIILTRNKTEFLKKYPWLHEYPEMSFLEGDITEFEFIDDHIDYIIHAATEASVKLNIEEPLTMFKTVVNGTKRALDFARLKNVKSFLLTSSGAVYGKQTSDMANISEDYLGAPSPSLASSMYGEGKRMAEVLCSVYSENYNIPVKVARCYAFIGPFLPLDSHFAAGNFIRNVLRGEDILIEGDGTPLRSYMYAADLVAWLWTILFEGEINRPYNVGSDESISIHELATLIAKNDDSDNVGIYIKTPRSNEISLKYVPNVDRATTELDLRIINSIGVAIKKTIDFNRKWNRNISNHE
ncbi:NAD-dependent epimerase/dehydratase family protein [Pedobacter hiemivivus]|uniref:NAD(P)-dependent oxidoreductase n=1 Tax=Pedobacter hiemivivus TaxID=2530454 RepID=A0A4R0N8D3_9SPHI|nr:NAD(P)-dependent oxidoreductase [Pedobacter hiemivivus]TCC96245.1 NAD(P)-dependent oxidoreductase [Pedobacter hiemivivus]